MAGAFLAQVSVVVTPGPVLPTGPSQIYSLRTRVQKSSTSGGSIFSTMPLTIYTNDHALNYGLKSVTVNLVDTWYDVDPFTSVYTLQV